MTKERDRAKPDAMVVTVASASLHGYHETVSFLVEALYQDAVSFMVVVQTRISPPTP